MVGGVDIMMSSDPRTVVHLACSPLLHYAFRVAKLRGCHGDDGNPYRAVRQYGTYARTPRARADGSLMHDRAMRGASCTAVFASTARALRAAPHDAASCMTAISERASLYASIRAGNANLLLA